MPKCIKCKKFFHPDFCVDVESPFIKKEEEVKMCVFCHLNLKEVTAQFPDGDKKISKQQAINEYKRYIDHLSKNRKIDHLIKTGTKSKIIMPGDKDY